MHASLRPSEPSMAEAESSSARRDQRTGASRHEDRTPAVLRRHATSPGAPLRRQTSFSISGPPRPVSDSSSMLLSGPRAGLALSPISSYSHTSWSGSTNTPEQLSPRTPEFTIPPTTHVACANETPITAFLTHFYDADPSATYDAGLNRFSAAEEAHSGLCGNIIDGRQLWSKQLPNLPTENRLEESDTPTPVTAARTTCSNPERRTAEGQLLSGFSVGAHRHPSLPEIRKTRRFARDFGVPLGGRLSQSEMHLPSVDALAPSGTIEEVGDALIDGPEELSAFPLNLQFPRPPSIGPDVANLFTEEETMAVKEFLRVWGSQTRGGPPTTPARVPLPPVLMARRGLEVVEDSEGQDSDEYSLEAEDDEAEAELSMRCSALLDQVSMMVGLPADPGSSGENISDTPAHGHDRTAFEDNRLRSHSDVAQRSSCGTNRGLSGFQIDKASEDVTGLEGRPVRFPPDKTSGLAKVPSQMSLGNCDLPAHEDIPGEARAEMSTRAVRVPVVLAQGMDETTSFEPFQRLPVSRDNSVDIVDSRNVSLRRWGQVFDLQSTGIVTNRSAVSINSEASKTAREAIQPRAPSTKRASALDRLELSLSKLKAHGPASQRRSQTFTEEDTATLPSRGSFFKRERRPSLPAALARPKKHQSSAVFPLTGTTGKGSLRDRHFSSPVHQSVPYLPYAPLHVPDFPEALRAPPRLERYDILQRRSAKQRPLVEDEDVPPMRSFMDMDMGAEKAHSPRRASMRTSVNTEKMRRLGRAAARLSQGVVAWGKNLTGSKKVHD
ncbi:hypothetical protein BV22DRAFT_1127942 [Leucogyrophana mollusca]|uniref:Uncharacterized protein n=1 Tax=Leucogyrophana mollusca TaxID=85980 RepID=A0ACB8BN75_9AGAM|nr:hypothetical protein BV22DRAFT_1127942 [Leucogyrophana mollusca]